MLQKCWLGSSWNLQPWPPPSVLIPSSDIACGKSAFLHGQCDPPSSQWRFQFEHPCSSVPFLIPQDFGEHHLADSDRLPRSPFEVGAQLSQAKLISGVLCWLSGSFLSRLLYSLLAKVLLSWRACLLRVYIDFSEKILFIFYVLYKWILLEVVHHFKPMANLLGT